jgi:hypothetical protein
MGPKDDELSFVPVTTAQRRFTKSDRPGVIVFSPLRREESAAAIANVREVLGLEHGFRPGDDRAVSFFDIQEVARLIDALGARDAEIFAQFLAESVAVTTCAGALGGLLGALAVHGLAAAIPPDNPMSPALYLEARSVVAIGVLLVAVGVVSGVVPARRAARIEPAISLRAL